MPLSEVQVRYLLSVLKDRSQIVVGVLPRRNSPNLRVVFGSKILISVPYENKTFELDYFD